MLGAGSEEQDYIWMSYDLHDSTLVFEFLQLVLLYDLLLDLLDSHSCVLPSASVYYSVTTLRKFPIELQIVVADLIVSLES